MIEQFEEINRKNLKQKGKNYNYLNWIECRGRDSYQVTIWKKKYICQKDQCPVFLNLHEPFFPQMLNPISIYYFELCISYLCEVF